MESDSTARSIQHNVFAPVASAAATLAAILAISLLGGCSSLLPPAPAADNVYLLEAGAAPIQTTTRGDASSPRQQRDLVLAVGMPRARAGFDTAQMVWVQQKHGLKVYSRNRWADTPAHMLAPLIIQSIERSGAFQAVVQTPSAVPAMLRLDTEVIRLQQDFSVKPSRLQITLGAQLIDVGAHRVIATAEFEESENAATEDAYGGVRAANLALERLLSRLTAFCVDHGRP